LRLNDRRNALFNAFANWLLTPYGTQLLRIRWDRRCVESNDVFFIFIRRNYRAFIGADPSRLK
jgi:hypothetical protein